MWAWIYENKDWLFSGVGLFILAGVGAAVRKIRSSTSVSTQSAGANAPNTKSRHTSARSENRYTDSIPLTSQNLGFTFGATNGIPPLRFVDGHRAICEVLITWKVINPIKFHVHATGKGHPTAMLVENMIPYLRQRLEVLTFSKARTRRTAIENAVVTKMREQFSARGIELERALLHKVA